MTDSLRQPTARSFNFPTVFVRNPLLSLCSDHLPLTSPLIFLSVLSLNLTFTLSSPTVTVNELGGNLELISKHSSHYSGLLWNLRGHSSLDKGRSDRGDYPVFSAVVFKGATGLDPGFARASTLRCFYLFITICAGSTFTENSLDTSRRNSLAYSLFKPQPP